jgi:hypothetical protein
MRCRIAIMAVLAALGLAACGGSGDHVPNLAGLPLVPGSRIVARTQLCDPGADAYCAIEFAVYNRRYANSDDLFGAEKKLLHRHHWTDANGLVGPESAADSPGHKLHLTYATAGSELDATAEHYVTRPRSIVSALSNSFFGTSTPAMAMILELDSGAT